MAAARDREALAKRDPGHRLAARPGGQLHKIGTLEHRAIRAEARELLGKGRAIIGRLAQIAACQRSGAPTSRFDEVLKTLDG